jgi:hypothetical protein
VEKGKTDDVPVVWVRPDRARGLWVLGHMGAHAPATEPEISDNREFGDVKRFLESRANGNLKVLLDHSVPW